MCDLGYKMVYNKKEVVPTYIYGKIRGQASNKVIVDGEAFYADGGFIEMDNSLLKIWPKDKGVPSDIDWKIEKDNVVSVENIEKLCESILDKYNLIYHQPIDFPVKVRTDFENEYKATYESDTVPVMLLPGESTYNLTEEQVKNLNKINSYVNFSVTKNELSEPVKRQCTCDFHTVIMRTGCVCGGK